MLTEFSRDSKVNLFHIHFRRFDELMIFQYLLRTWRLFFSLTPMFLMLVLSVFILKLKQRNYRGMHRTSSICSRIAYCAPLRAYVVPRGGVAAFKSTADRDAFALSIQKWIQTKVAKHKYLRGGKFRRILERPVIHSSFSFRCCSC